MTKFIEQRVDELENQVAKLELIIHELRGKKSIEPSTTNTVVDIIEYEGQQYKKVDREAHEGDVVVFDKSVKFHGTEIVTKGKLYKAKKGTLGELAFVDNEGDSVNVYDGGITKFTPENVAVYELIKPKPLTPNQQRAAIIEQAKKFIEEKGKGFDFSINQNKRIIAFNIYTEKAGFAKCNPSDVFNEHIGKAIALGRALGLDVSEFEQVVQPTEFAIGQEIEYTHEIRKGEKRTIESIRGDLIKMVCGRHFNLSWGNSEPAILNDTNAIY